MRVLAVDPGLTRCGIGIVDGAVARPLSCVAVGVITTDSSMALEQRLLRLDLELRSWIEKYSPDVIAVERVFSQHNLRTVMGTAQAAGIALVTAAHLDIPVVMHTPSEVKAAVTGSGRADKKQVAQMVQKLLGLVEIPKPVDSTDALALAICHIWRGSGDQKIEKAVATEKARLAKVGRR